MRSRCWLIRASVLFHRKHLRCPQVSEEVLWLAGVCFIRSIIPLMRGPSSWPNHHPAPPNPMFEFMTFPLGFNICIWRNTNIQFLAFCACVLFFCLFFFLNVLFIYFCQFQAFTAMPGLFLLWQARAAFYYCAWASHCRDFSCWGA